ncbi:hypothetical protein [Sphingomonas sp. 2R-10]|uniref:hypothetical protein n=1 Tax=Sphingomonas sp. 2R-10 TaxID=3045148 RepID=UPI0013DE29B6|nr:hypothetical protein [Sphingomonas sp. 2R-10]
MREFSSVEIENRLEPDMISQATCMLEKVERVLANGVIIYDAPNQLHSQSIGVYGYSTEVRVDFDASSVRVEIDAERFSCCEMRHFRATPPPQTLDDLIKRIPAWLSYIAVPTDPPIIQSRDAASEQAFDALQAAVTASDPDWWHIILYRYSSSIVRATVHGTGDSRDYATADLDPSEKAFSMSDALCHALIGSPDYSCISDGARQRSNALDIVMWPPLPYIRDNSLSVMGKLRAIALAAEKDFRLLD